MAWGQSRPRGPGRPREGGVRELLFPVRHDSDVGLQAQLRRHLVGAILDGRLDSDSPLPSCRRLAHALGVSRNTVVIEPFFGPKRPRNTFRLGFSSIPAEKIAPGIEKLAEIMNRMA